MIKFIDVKTQNNILHHGFLYEISKIINSGQYIMDENLEEFEHKFADYIGVKYAVGVNSGTDALRFALMAYGIKGDVLTVSHTFPATIMAIMSAGANPVFVDVNESGLMDVEDLKKKINEKTQAIIPVHFMGHPCNMDEINAIAKKNCLTVIEDACQAAGAVYKDKKTGSLGDIGCFSFFPTKNLSCCGDGGMITTNYRSIYDKCKLLRDFGRITRENFVMLGHNSRLDEIQAAVLLYKLPFLDYWTVQRNKAADYYIKNLDFLKCVVPTPDSISAWHLFVAKVPDNRLFVKEMFKRGVDCRIHYSIPSHRQAFIGSKAELPNTDALCKTILSLPISESISRRTQDIVIEKLRECYYETT